MLADPCAIWYQFNLYTPLPPAQQPLRYHSPMRLLLVPAALISLAACNLVRPQPSPTPVLPASPSTAPATPAIHGFTPEEEATILRLEDRRELDPAVTDAWLSNPNALHRARMALALGRIGPATFIDTNGNGE